MNGRRRYNILIIIVLLVLFYFYSDYYKLRKNSLSDPGIQFYMNEWLDCMRPNVSQYKTDPIGLWKNLWKSINQCERLAFMSKLKIKNFSNSDETKRSIIPKMDEPSVIITLGIGHDVAAEKKIKQLLPKDSKFYGADPMQETNKEIFTEMGGVYFPFAVGATSGVHLASVLRNGSRTDYFDKNVVHVDLVYFLKHIIRETLIDDLWMDAEGAEYGLMPYFYKGGELDKAGITICQFNMEVHKPDLFMKETFRKFILRILEDERYAFLRPVQGDHLRLYFLNFSNQKCVNKYTFTSNC